MDRAMAQSIMQEVKANRARLEGCERHKFVVTEKLQRRVVCLNCGGEMATLDAIHYRDGYKAAGGKLDVLVYYV